jgi:hypothetical protein
MISTDTSGASPMTRLFIAAATSAALLASGCGGGSTDAAPLDVDRSAWAADIARAGGVGTINAGVLGLTKKHCGKTADELQAELTLLTPPIDTGDVWVDTDISERARLDFAADMINVYRIGLTYVCPDHVADYNVAVRSLTDATFDFERACALSDAKRTQEQSHFAKAAGCSPLGGWR